MAMARLSDPTPRMTLPRALLSEALRLARSPLTAVHLVCGLAAGLACGEYFSVARWDPALGADAYAQFLGALMPLMSAIVCGLAVDEERAAGRLANLTAVPSRGRAVAFFSVGGLAHGLMTGELTGALATPLSWVPLAWPARLGSLGVEAFIDAARAAGPLLTTALAGLVLTLATAAVLLAWFCRFEDGRADA